MSHQATTWVMEFSQSKLADRLVMLAIAHRVSNDNGEAFPSVETIAWEARVSERTAHYSIKALVEIGELEVETCGSKKGTNVYRFPLFLQWVQSLHPTTTNGVQSTTGRGAIHNGEGVHAVAPEPSEENHQEPSEERHEDPSAVFKECKRYYRRLTGKSPGNVPPSRGEEWVRIVQDKTGDVVFEAFKLWVDDTGKDRLRGFKWAMAVFCKGINEHIEAYEDKRLGESEAAETLEEVSRVAGPRGVREELMR